MRSENHFRDSLNVDSNEVNSFHRAMNSFNAGSFIKSILNIILRL